MSKEEKIPETKAEERAEEYVETEFVKEMAVEPVEVPDVTYEGEIVGWTEHMPHHEGEHHEHHEHHKEDPEELVETEFVKEMAVEPVDVPDVTYEGEIVGWTEHMPHHEHTEEKK